MLCLGGLASRHALDTALVLELDKLLEQKAANWSGLEPRPSIQGYQSAPGDHSLQSPLNGSETTGSFFAPHVPATGPGAALIRHARHLDWQRSREEEN